MRLNRIPAIGEKMEGIAQENENRIAAAEPTEIKNVRQMRYDKSVRA